MIDERRDRNICKMGLHETFCFTIVQESFYKFVIDRDNAYVVSNNNRVGYKNKHMVKDGFSILYI